MIKMLFEDYLDQFEDRETGIRVLVLTVPVTLFGLSILRFIGLFI